VSARLTSWLGQWVLWPALARTHRACKLVWISISCAACNMTACGFQMCAG
jgi:hypothetical protein